MLAKSFSIAVRSFSMAEVTFWRMPVNHEPIDVGLEPEDDAVLEALIRL